MSKVHWKDLGKAMLKAYAVIGFCWWWNETSPLGWWNLKPRIGDYKEMEKLYQHRVFPYPGDEEAVKRFIEEGGAYGTTIGPRDVRKKAGDDFVAHRQKETFQREADKLWIRMQNEVLREFHEQGYTVNEGE